MISHEEGTCPELTPEQREANRLARLEKKEKEELAAREAFSAPIRGRELHTRTETLTRTNDTYSRHPYGSEAERKSAKQSFKRDDSARTEQTRKTEYGDLRRSILSKRDDKAKNVWKRLEHSYEGNPQNRERHHPYRRDNREDSRISNRDSASRYNRGRYGDSASSSSWRVKNYNSENRGNSQEVQIQEQERERRGTEQISRLNRNSPDSQRTISEIHRYTRKEATRRTHQSPRQQIRVEWQPRRSMEREATDHIASSPIRRSGSEAHLETEDEKRRRLKGKAVAVDNGEKSTQLVPTRTTNGILRLREPLQTELPANQVYLRKEKVLEDSTEKDKAPGGDTEAADHPPRRRRSSQEPELERNMLGQGDPRKQLDEIQGMTDEELKELEDQYASVDFEMDEDMLDNDDLLDEDMVEETFVPDSQAVGTQNRELQNKEGRELGEQEKDRTSKEKEIPTGQEMERNKKQQTSLGTTPNINKRRGLRSPDPKEQAAKARAPLLFKSSKLDDGPLY
ncbi:Uncharacterized protein Rs2_41196 [Raphanus sativus]|nr:Uncharacterized protein Rs2_41196 [Raphanus sativus]